MSNTASFPLAQELRSGTANLGEVFSFLSSLYFRGKLAYAQAFANPPAGAPGVMVITPGGGLRLPVEQIGLDSLRAFAEVDVDERNPLYRDPLERDARQIAEMISSDIDVILLGSIATGKYLSVLSSAFGSCLKFPADFIGRGDMSRGGLMLRCVDSGAELDYIEASEVRHRGPRPPKLPKR